MEVVKLTTSANELQKDAKRCSVVPYKEYLYRCISFRRLFINSLK